SPDRTRRLRGCPRTLSSPASARGSGNDFQDNLMNGAVRNALLKTLIDLVDGRSLLGLCFQGDLEDLVHVLHELEFQRLLNVLGDLSQVLFVVSGKDDGVDAQAVGR